MARAFDITPLDATFGAVVTGIKLVDLDETGWRNLHAAWLDYALLVFPDQHLKRDQQIAFARRFGPLEFEMAAISNVRSDGTLRVEKDNDDVMKILKGNMGWHADSTYMPVQAKGAVFSAEVVPTIGGQTGFADMRAAYDALDDARKARVEQLQAHHSLHYSQSRLGHETRKADGEYNGYGLHDGPVPLRPLVKTHPETGRKVASDRPSRPRHSRPRPGRVRALPAGADRLRLPATAHLPSRLGAGRRGAVGQSLPAAPGDALGHDPEAHHVAQPHRRRPGQRDGAGALTYHRAHEAAPT